MKFEKLEILDLNINKISELYQNSIKQKLKLSEKYIGKEGLKDLTKINFNNLEILNLSKNKISDINILEKVNFKKIKGLHLFYNNISDIKILEKIEFEK